VSRERKWEAMADDKEYALFSILLVAICLLFLISAYRNLTKASQPESAEKSILEEDKPEHLLDAAHSYVGYAIALLIGNMIFTVVEYPSLLVLVHFAAGIALAIVFGRAENTRRGYVAPPPPFFRTHGLTVLGSMILIGLAFWFYHWYGGAFLALSWLVCAVWMARD
jgi:hypothetical protein